MTSIDPTTDTGLDGVWLFDGVCNFCSRSVRLALALDRKGMIRFTPLQSPFGRAIAARHGLDLENPASFLPQVRARFILEPPPGWR